MQQIEDITLSSKWELLCPCYGELEHYRERGSYMMA